MIEETDLVIIMNAFCKSHKIKVSVFKKSKLHKHAKLRCRLIKMLISLRVKPKAIAALLEMSVGYIYQH